MKDVLTIGIIGCRSRDSEYDLRLTTDKFFEVLGKLKCKHIKIVSGGCELGGDRFAEKIANDYSFKIQIYFPDTSKMNPDGDYRSEYRRVAFERNTLVAKDADILIACVENPDDLFHGGTGDTIKKYLKRFNKKYLFIV